MLESIWKKGFVIGIVFVFLGASTALGMNTFTPTSRLPGVVSHEVQAVVQDVLVSFSVYEKSDVKNCQIMLSYDEAKFIYDLFEKLQNDFSNDSFTDETKNLKTSFINLLNEKGLLPDGISNEEVIELLNPSLIPKLKQNKLMTSFLPSPKISSSKASAFFCSIISGGTGKTTPFAILPRPHAIILWKGTQGQEYTITTVGGINSGKGFIAYGNQNGMAIGFEGVGLTYGTPIGTVYALTGIAVYASTTADYIEFYPPNNKPEILNSIPSNNQENIPITLDKLIFTIQDEDNDLMSYSVTTTPSIGSGSGTSKNGICSIDVEGLQDSTNYQWTVEVSDGKDTTTRSFSFTTEYLAPQILDPTPINGAYYISPSLSTLSFTLKDYQNDLIDWTLQTLPDIGSGSGTQVSNGRFNIPITGLLEHDRTYYWYVNVTDGTHWNRQVFRFTTVKEGIGSYLYAGGDDGVLVRYNKMTMSQDLSINYGAGLRSIISDGKYLYVAGLSEEGTIWQLWPSNLSKRMESEYCGSIFSLDYDGRYLYVACSGDSMKVMKFKPSDLTKISESIDLGGTGIWMIDHDEKYLYVVGGIDYESGYLYQLWSSNLTIRRVATGNSGFYFSVLVIGEYVYVGTSCTVDEGVIKKFRVSDLIEVDSVEYGGTVFAFAYDGTSLYAGGHNTQKIYKYSLPDLTKIVESPDYGGYIVELSYDGTCLYAGGLSTDTIWQLNPSDLSVIRQSAANWGNINALWTGP